MELVLAFSRPAHLLLELLERTVETGEPLTALADLVAKPSGVARAPEQPEVG